MRLAIARLNRQPKRRGSLIPLLAVSAISLFGFVALAVDLGMLAVSRTECQNAADAAALVGCRTLNNKEGVVNSNLPKAVENAKATATSNYHLSANFTELQIDQIEAGQYLYDPTNSVFRVSIWTPVKDSQGSQPQNGGSWTAIRVTMAVTQPTYFMRVFGVTTMPTGAVASAVYRPRDIAFVLDMSGSMGYASTFTYNDGGPYRTLNPDNLVPAAGHYVSNQQWIRATDPQYSGDNEAISLNNFTIATAGGPAQVRHFYFDPANAANPTTSANPVTVSGGEAVLKPAFHRWSPPESGGDSTTATPPTYDFTGYDPMHNGSEPTPMGPTPAPDSYGTMTDYSASVKYNGDRWRRADGTFSKTQASWATGNSATKAATTAIELLGYNVNGTNVRGGTSGGTTITTTDRFRDPVWEQYGYDLDVKKYRDWRGTGSPTTVANYLAAKGGTESAILVEDGERFKGYSMGPGYWGKTFYIWPPDPRTPNTAQPSGGDWRRRFFTVSDPQSTTTGINESLLSTGNLTIASNATINYAAVLKWIKSGPQVLPSNLRAGRVLYYSSIPDDVNISGSATSVLNLDKLFWKNYIDYVVGRTPYNNNQMYLYGFADSWASAPTSIFTNDMQTWNGPSNNWTPTNRRPYMNYSDSPKRPRLHLWFGPLSMMDFLTARYSDSSNLGNWRAGTVSEAQCWQLKAGMRAVIDDVRNNHPNDYIGMTMFSGYTGAGAYNGIRVPMGQNYNRLKNALFYPRSLLDAIEDGDQTAEFRPFNSSFDTNGARDNIPNATAYTDPNTGLAYAFNLLSPSTLLSSEYDDRYGNQMRGRRGAAKVVIFETDGVPNSVYSNGNGTMNPTLRGYNTYYAKATSFSFLGNTNTKPRTEAVKVVNQITKQSATNANTGTDSGLSLPNAPARVYPIAFGDLFDPVASPDATYRTTALQFMADIAEAGNTGPKDAATIPPAQVITGPYQQRIDRLRDVMQRIFQSGVSVALIE